MLRAGGCQRCERTLRGDTIVIPFEREQRHHPRRRRRRVAEVRRRRRGWEELCDDINLEVVDGVTCNVLPEPE